MKKSNRNLLWALVALLLITGVALQLLAVPNTLVQVFSRAPAAAETPEKPVQAKKGAVAAKLPWHRLNDAKDLDLLLKEIGDAQVVLLGEATHGTSEFYTWRATITRRLVEEKGFKILAVEGDWPESQHVNRYIKGQEHTNKSPEQVLQAFDRWPTWMWANHEVAAMVTWLRDHNRQLPPAQQVGFYGLDLYSLCKSLIEVSDYLKQRDGAVPPAAQRAIACYRSYNGKPEDYATGVLYSSDNCKKEFAQLLQALQTTKGQTPTEAQFDAEQNALVAVNAENYYRMAARSDSESWNIRDRHMMQTLARVLKQHGAGAKAVVWEHNTHIGDARATDMAGAGMVNLGQLAREQLGADKVYAVGFGTYQGTVLAASAWEKPVKRMTIPAALKDSWEHKLHAAGEGNKLVVSGELRKAGTALRTIGHRAIGVVYDPATETSYNYVPTQITKRYDAFIFIDKTQALHPLTIPIDSTFPPSLHPWVF